MGSKRKRQACDMPDAAPAAKKHEKVSKPSNPSPPVTAAAPTLFLDKPKGADLKREVQLYEQLSSQDSAERLEAADAVVSGLLGGDGVSETILQRHLERKLFRGLASGRKGARLGFSVVLTELLAQLFGKKQLSKARYTGLPFENMLDILSAKTKPEGDLSGQEERDHALGLLFGLQCFVRADILFEEGEERWEKIFKTLLKLAKKRPWMREECGWVVVEALEQMKQPQAEETLEKLHEAGLAATPEGVGVWLVARRRFPDMKFPRKPWGHDGNPLKHLKALATALKESSSTTDGDEGRQVQQTGNWNAQLHFVWNLVLDQYLEEAKAGEASTSHDFENFWNVAVDENLFSASASSERKFWGFQLFQKMLKAAVPYRRILGSIFSHNLMRCLINHASQEDRLLHRAADKSLKTIQRTIEADPSTVVIILPKLISDSGVYNFDQVTKTKTIDKILSQVDGDHALAAIITLSLPARVVKTADSARDAEVRRQTFGDYLLSMIRHTNTTNISKHINWVEKLGLPSLASLAYSKEESFQPKVSERTRTIFRNRLTSALTHLISNTDGFSYPCELLKTLKPSAVDMDYGITAAKDKALAIMEKLMKKAKKAAEQEKKPMKVLASLFALVILQLYDGEADAITLLDELRICYEKLICGKGKAESEDASAVLVEILLSFLSKPSGLLRKISQNVFAAFSGEVSGEGLKLMADVLASSESLKGQQELFDRESSENDPEDEGDEEDELDSDVKVIGPNGTNGSVGSHETDDEDEDTVGDEDEDNVGGQDSDDAQKLDEALAEALGTHRADQDLKEESSESDADMSDSEMMALDSKLVEIFSQRKKLPNKKQEKKDARETIVNLKSRVLDLLEIFVKEQTTNPLAFWLLLPLLTLMRTTTAKHLSKRAHGVITAFAKASKGLKVQDDLLPSNISKRIQILKDVHAEAAKDPSHAFAKAASTASLLVATNLYRASKSNTREIATIYRDTQAAWVEGEVKMQASFFHEWVNWCQSHAL